MKENWNFWSNDWSARITVAWNPKEVKLSQFREDIKKHVGSKFKYERAITLEPTFESTTTGLQPIK